MSCLGVHFALTQKEADHLRSIANDTERLQHLQEVIEESYFNNHPNLVAESDKAWDAMHRALADGKLTWNGGKYPLNHTILAGELLYDGNDYIMSLKDSQQVRDIADALSKISEADFRKRYFAIDQTNLGLPLSEEDFAYTWDWFQGVRELYQRAAKENRLVLFTADQ
jgi:hypothetical protein